MRYKLYNETKTKQELLRLQHKAKQIPTIQNPYDKIKAIIEISNEVTLFNSHTDRYNIRYERGEIK